MRHLYDVIVAGAGPGGSSVAARLAQAGYDVLLLEKAAFPRYKVCGGGVTGRAWAKMPVDITPVVRTTVDTFETVFAGRESQVFQHKRPFVFATMRDELDDMLARHAVACGASLQTQTMVTGVVEQSDRVIVQTQHQGAIGRGETAEITGKFLVGADGVHSAVAKQAGLMARRKKVLALEYEIAASGQTLQRFENRILVDYGMVETGYTWVFPKKDHLSVGIGSFSLAYPALSQQLMRFMAQQQLGGQVLSAKGSFLSEGGQHQPIVTARVALIGDAAGLVEAIAGEGIFYALYSAELLAERLPEALAGKAGALGCYQDDVDAYIWPELSLLDRVGRRFYANPQRVQQIIAKFPFVMTLILEVLEGRRSYTGMYQIIKEIGLVRDTVRKVKRVFS